MRKLGMCFTAALVTFSIGLSIAAVLVSQDQLPQRANVDLVGIVQEELLPSPDITASESSELVIAIESSEPNLNPDPPSPNHRYIKLSKRDRALFDLELGDVIDNQEVELKFRDRSVEYRMFERYRTSMSLSLEGPHIDLLNWRHFDSPWIALPSPGAERFRMLAVDQIEHSKFPPTTKSEIIKEVSRHVGNDWPKPMEFVKSCTGPNEGACIVSVSSIYLRIQKKVKTQWKDVGFVEVRIPMGC